MPALVEGWEGFQQGITDRFISIAQDLGSVLHTHVRLSDEPSSTEQDQGSPFTVPVSDVQSFHHWRWPWIVKPRSKSRAPFNRVQFNVRRRKTEFPGNGEVRTVAPPSNPMMTGVHELGERVAQAGTELFVSIGGFLGDLGKHVSSRVRGAASETAETAQSSQAYTNLAEAYRSSNNQLAGNWREADNGCTSTQVATRRRVRYRSNAADNGDNGGGVTQSTRGNAGFNDISNDELIAIFTKKHQGLYRQGSINVTTTYDSRSQDIGSSVTARGDLWRVEASSHSGSQPGHGANPLFLLQIGPILFVRNSTLLLPIHLSKQHLLWYGYDRKNGVHSICPAVWSKHRRWLLMSMICLNPLNCSFMDLQFPNGQLTYVAGEGLTSSLFSPLLGGFLQARTHRPGATKLSFSKKMSWGSRVTPSIQLADKSFSLDVLQPLVWQRSGMIVRPTIKLRVKHTVGGRNAGWKAEVVHSPKEKLIFACGCVLTVQPTAYASISVGKSKRNGNDAGNAGIFFHVETPVENPGRASFFIRLNSGVEF